jgi:predicted nucleic acid-binding protein
LRVLFDTNVVLDLLLARSPFDVEAVELFRHAHSGTVVSIIGATTVTTIHYLACKTIGAAMATQKVRQLVSLCEVAPVTKAVLVDALTTGLPDFEDGLLEAAAYAVNADSIVTRDKKGFIGARLPVYAPDVLVAALQARADE